MKRQILVVLIMLFPVVLLAQDTTAVKKKKTVFEHDSTRVKKYYGKNLGLYAGVHYSVSSIESNAYFLDDTGTVGKSHMKNGVGFAGGLFYPFTLGKHFILRPGVEGSLTRMSIVYDAKNGTTQESEIFPVTVEVPLTLIFTKQNGFVTDEQGELTGRKSFLPEISIGVRPVFPMVQFNSVRPTVKTFNFNVDFALGYPFPLKKGMMRTELLFSYGLLNIIGEDDKDIKTSSVVSINRSIVGLRVYFN